jgi:hypothetical protein
MAVFARPRARSARGRPHWARSARVEWIRRRRPAKVSAPANPILENAKRAIAWIARFSPRHVARGPATSPPSPNRPLPRGRNAGIGHGRRLVPRRHDASGAPALHRVVPRNSFLSRLHPRNRPPPGRSPSHPHRPGPGEGNGWGEDKNARRRVSRVLSRRGEAVHGYVRRWRPFIWDARRRAPLATDPGGGAEARLVRSRGPATRPTRRPYLVLLPVGFAVPPPLPATRCALTAPFHPCRPSGFPKRTRRCAFCGTFPGVSPAGRYPAPHLRGARTFLSSP